MPGCLDRPADAYGPAEAGCSTNAFSSAAFDFTVRGAIPDGSDSSHTLLRSCAESGATAIEAEKNKRAPFARRAEGVREVRLTGHGDTWRRRREFRPFGVDVFGALGTGAIKAVDRFARLRGGRHFQSPATCRRKTRQALVAVALHSSNAKVLRCRRPQLSS